MERKPSAFLFFFCISIDFSSFWLHQSIQDERVELIDGIGQKSSNGKNVDHYDGTCRCDIMPTLPRAILVACDGYAI